MNTHLQANIGDILLCLSKAQSIVSPTVGQHQLQVAYLSYSLAKELHLPEADQQELFLAALVHDIGALSIKEKLDLIEQDIQFIHTHAMRGALLLEDFEPLKPAANIVRYHHVNWDYEAGLHFHNETVPVTSHIMHLADSVCVQFHSSSNVLSQVPKIVENACKHSGSVYAPEHVDALVALSKKEYIWLDMMSKDPISTLPAYLMQVIQLHMDDLIGLSQLLSHLIDFRSRFTAKHSAGVAKIAERIAELSGFSSDECKEMLIAGYLHDLGKLVVGNDILEKHGPLTEEEFNVMRSHTYYTYYLLNDIPGLDIIKTWAAYHHEKLDGTGYPFHITGDYLSLGARIMAVADIFTAIKEDRPYRKEMADSEAIRILKDMAQNGSIDSNIVNLVVSHFSDLNAYRTLVQNKASEDYEHFFHAAASL